MGSSVLLVAYVGRYVSDSTTKVVVGFGTVHVLVASVMCFPPLLRLVRHYSSFCWQSGAVPCDNSAIDIGDISESELFHYYCGLSAAVARTTV